MKKSSAPRPFIIFRASNLKDTNRRVNGNGVQIIASIAPAPFWSPSGGRGRASMQLILEKHKIRTVVRSRKIKGKDVDIL